MIESAISANFDSSIVPTLLDWNIWRNRVPKMSAFNMQIHKKAVSLAQDVLVHVEKISGSALEWGF